jgi:hypothetical protein
MIQQCTNLFVLIAEQNDVLNTKKQFEEKRNNFQRRKRMNFQPKKQKKDVAKISLLLSQASLSEESYLPLLVIFGNYNFASSLKKKY